MIRRLDEQKQYELVRYMLGADMLIIRHRSVNIFNCVYSVHWNLYKTKDTRVTCVLLMQELGE